MKTKSVLFIAIFTLQLLMVCGQTNEGLKIGKKVPDLLLNTVVNYPKKTLRLSELTGKVVLLDFWFTSCTACLAGFPKLEALQKKFKDDLQVILVNDFEDENRIKQFYARWQRLYGSKLNLATALSTEKLKELFPHQSAPHCIWIDKSGVLRAVTAANLVTEVNIAAVIKGEKINLKEKKDLADFDRDKPLFVNGNGGGGDNIKYRSMLTGFIEDLQSATSRKFHGNLVSRYTYVNTTVLKLYETAFQCFLPANRVFIETKQIEVVNDYVKKDHEWRVKNFYTYELITDPLPRDSFYQLMREDLSRYFGYPASFEKRKLKVLLLKSNGNNNAVTKGGESDWNLSENKAQKQFVRNQPIVMVAERLDDVLPFPVIDETGIKGKVDLELPNDLTDIETLRVCLEKSGFKLVEEEREMKVFVIKEKEKK